jgi:hypothetical protein
MMGDAMRAKFLIRICVITGMWFSGISKSDAVEFSLGLYALGSGAIGAGQTPPVGAYLTDAFSYSEFQAFKAIPFAGTTIVAKIYLPAMTGNILAVLPQPIFGGHLSLSGTTGYGNMLLNAGIFGPLTAQKSTDGWGATDSNLRASLGWDITPTFSHKISITAYLPTGRYDAGFNPNLGLNRLGADISWGASYIEPTSKIELSGTAGFTYEGYNPATLYSSGNTVHFEEGLSKHFENGFRAGIVSYQFIQVSDDTGAGAVLGPFLTNAVAVGPSFGYTTQIEGHLVSFTGQATRDIAFDHRLQDTMGVFSTTVKF